MSRVFSGDLGIEKAFLLSYNGWSETDVGVQFENVELNYQYDHIDADILHLNYADCEAEFYLGDILMKTIPIKIVPVLSLT